MDQSTLPIPIDELKAMMEKAEAEEEAKAQAASETVASETVANEVEAADENIELDIEANNGVEQDEIFEKPKEDSKPKKKKKQLTEKQLAALARAREAGLKKRQAKAAAKKKEAELYKLEKTKHIRARKKKQLDDEALIMAHAEVEHERKEKAMWDEERLVQLMNKTMDTYFEKRKKEKTHRTTVPIDPAQGGYYVPAQPPQPIKYQATQAPPPQPHPQIDRTNPNHPQYNPYLSLFNLK